MKARRRWLAGWSALVLVACGRVGYDPVGPPGGGDAGPCTGTWSAPERVEAVSLVGVDDWAPFESADGLELYLASWREGGAGMSDLYVATRARLSDPFGAPVSLGDVNTDAFESAPCLSPDGQTLFLVGPSPFVVGEVDILESSRAAGGDFGAAIESTPISANGNDVEIEITRDGLNAYFASDRPGASGKRDFWLAKRAAPGDDFGAPTPVDELNSTQDESSLTVSADQLEVIFSSARAGGAGGFDLWQARRARADDPWGEPVRLPELSSPEDDTRPALSFDGQRLYFNFAAYEEGGDDSDIWIATRCAP